jgi:hypothetical protein
MKPVLVPQTLSLRFQASAVSFLAEERRCTEFPVRYELNFYMLCRRKANIKLILHKALIRPVMTYACPAWEFAAECHLLKLQRLQNKVLRTIGNFSERTSVRDMHKAFHILYVYDYITNHAGNKQKSSKIMKMNMFATLDKAKPTQKM